MTSAAAQGDPTALEREFGPLLRGWVRPYFEPVRFPPEAEGLLRDVCERGFVVHVMRTTSWVNYLYLAWACVRRGLPPVRAVVNLRRWLTRPWRLAAGRGEPGVRFTYARRHSGSGLVFLKRSAWARPLGRNSPEDPFPALVAFARRAERPVFLVPELFVWEKWSARLKPGPMDLVFGSPEAPGFLHSVVAFWRNHQRAQFRVGDPIDLSRFIAEHPDDDDIRVARKVRSALGVHLARETRAVFGPPFKPAGRVIEETLRDRNLRKTLVHESQKEKRPLDGLIREARRDLKSIAARFHPTVVGLSAPFFDWIFNRIYDGIEVDEAGLHRAMGAAATAPVVLCPSHKSHIDYLILSWVLWKRGYTVPLVAAGANLSFFPLGPYFRHLGAFFLRRSFKDDPVYTAVFKAYLKKLVRDRVHQEFFPEGTRSRTGKLLRPKLGMLTWQVDAVLEGASPDLVFIPAAIDYEKVVESQSYTHELSGGEKKPEDLKALLSAPRVLTSRYGRIHLTFDQPVSLQAFARSRGVVLDAGLEDAAKKNLVQALGNRIMYGISRVSTVTPQALVCTALLSGDTRPVHARDLSDRIQMLRKLVADAAAPVSRLLDNAPSDPTVIGAVLEAIRSLAQEGLLQIQGTPADPEYQTAGPGRMALSYYKNTLMNLVAPRSVVANALKAGPGDRIEDVRGRALFLSRVFKLEFVYPVGVPFEALFSAQVDTLAREGVILPPTDVLVPAPESYSRPMLDFFASLLQDYLEAYWLTVDRLHQTPQAQLDRRAWVRAVLEHGRELLSRGRIQRPEALSRSIVDNALGYLIDQGLLSDEGKMLRVPATPEALGGLARMAGDLRRYFPA